MSIEQQRSPTFELRIICQKIQTGISQRLGELSTFYYTKDNAVNEEITESNTVLKDKYSLKKLENSQQASLLQKVKDDLCRIISSSLPQVVSYETKVNETIQDLRQELQEIKKQLKKQKQNYKDSILEKDGLKLEILQFEHQNKQLADELQIMKQKYNEAIDLCGTYMQEIRNLQAQRLQEQQKTKKLLTTKSNKNLTVETPQYQQSFISNYTKQTNRDINFPLQIKQKLNEAEKVLSRSPRSNDPHLQSSHFQLSTEIVGCQKQLLEIELRESEKEKAQMFMELQQQKGYSQKLQKQGNNLQRLLDGEKKLNQKLDRQLYMMINVNKEMKIQLLQQKARTKHLQQEIYELQQQAGLNAEETNELQTKITKLQIEQKNMQKLQDQLQELKQKLSISHKKYQQLRKIKQQLEDKVQEFEEKLQEIQKKQFQDQQRNQQFHKIIKSQNISKIKQIQELSSSIKQKYQQKLSIIEKQYRQLKDKHKDLKQQNNRLYEGIDLQAKKSLKIDQKYAQTKKILSQTEQQNKLLKRDKQLLQQKLKTQTLLAKELKRQLNLSQKSKQFNQRKLKRLQISLLPRLISQLKSIKEEAMIVKSSVLAYKQMIINIYSKNCALIQKEILLKVQYEKQKISALNSQLYTKNSILDQLKKQSHTSQHQKVDLLERNTTLQSKQRELSQEITKKDQQISSYQKKLSFFEEKTLNLQKQLEKYKDIQKSSMQKIEILRAKQTQVQNFYDLVNELSKQNEKLKQKLDKFMLRNEQENLKRRNQQRNIATFSPTSDNEISGYMVPQRLVKQKNQSRSREALINKNMQSHSCLHHRQLNNSKSHLMMQKSPSLQKKSAFNPNKISSTSYERTLPYNLPIHSRPVQFNSRNNITSPFVQKFQTLNSYQQNPIFYNQGQKMKQDFQSQKNRLQNIRNEYQKLMIDKFRDQFIQHRKY